MRLQRVTSWVSFEPTATSDTEITDRYLGGS